MRYFPITLSVIRPNWSAKNMTRRVEDDGAEATQKIFERDDYTCQCCGFRAQKHQRILHVNGDDRDWADDNVLTTCVFCHQCFDLDSVGKMDSGMLIWLPELSQSDLHHMMRAIYVARVAQGGLAEAARDVHAQIMARGEEARKRLGSTSPEALAIILRDFLTTPQYREAQERMDGIRLLPLDRRMITGADGQPINEFPQILAHWRSTGPFAPIPPQKWAELFAAKAA